MISTTALPATRGILVSVYCEESSFAKDQEAAARARFAELRAEDGTRQVELSLHHDGNALWQVWLLLSARCTEHEAAGIVSSLRLICPARATRIIEHEEDEQFPGLLNLRQGDAVRFRMRSSCESCFSFHGEIVGTVKTDTDRIEYWAEPVLS